MADRSIPPKDKRLLVRFLQHCMQDAASDGDSEAAQPSQATASSSGEEPSTAPGSFTHMLESEFKLPADLQRFIVNAMTWRDPSVSAR